MVNKIFRRPLDLFLKKMSGLRVLWGIVEKMFRFLFYYYPGQLKKTNIDIQALEGCGWLRLEQDVEVCNPREKEET